jgi:hypothetical protein
MGDEASKVLSDAECERIRHETIVRAEVHREVETALAKKFGWFNKLNSPFVITFLGGVCITLAGQAFVRVGAATERDRARDEAIFEKKVSVASSYANDIETAVLLAGTVKKKRLWLRANQGPDARDDLGRSRTEMEKEFWEAWKLQVQARKFPSVITEVLTVFTSLAVQRAAQELVNAFKAEDASKTDEEVERHDADEEKQEGELARAMSDEIRQGNR